MDIEKTFSELFPLRGSQLVLNAYDIEKTPNEVLMKYEQKKYNNGVTEEEEENLFRGHFSDSDKYLIGFNGFASDSDKKLRSFAFDIDFKILKKVKHKEVINKIIEKRDIIINNYYRSNFGKEYGVVVISRNGGLHFYIMFSDKSNKFPLASEIIDFANLLPITLGFKTKKEQTLLGKVDYDDLSEEDKEKLDNGDVTILEKVVIADFDTGHTLPTQIEKNGSTKPGSIYLPYKGPIGCDDPMGYGIDPVTYEKLSLERFCELLKERSITARKINKTFMPTLKKLTHRCTKMAYMVGIVESSRHNALFSVLRSYVKNNKGEVKTETLEELVRTVVRGEYDASNEINEVLSIPKDELQLPHLLNNHPFCDEVCRAGSKKERKIEYEEDHIVEGGEWKVIDKAVKSPWGIDYRYEYYNYNGIGGYDVIPNYYQDPEKSRQAAAIATKGTVFFKLPGGSKKTQLFQEMLHRRNEEASTGEVTLTLKDYSNFKETKDRAIKLLRHLNILYDNSKDKPSTERQPYVKENRITFTEHAIEAYYVDYEIPVKVQEDLNNIFINNHGFDYFGKPGEQISKPIFFIPVKWIFDQQGRNKNKDVFKENMDEARDASLDEKVIDLTSYKREEVIKRIESEWNKKGVKFTDPNLKKEWLEIELEKRGIK